MCLINEDASSIRDMGVLVLQCLYSNHTVETPDMQNCQ